MDKEKIKNSLQKIKREVDDFHPHLRKFFDELPEVIDVDYTHGNSEFGADFVLTTQHEVEGMNYIGIVAKVGTVNQTILHKIDEQITECFNVSRPVENGKRRAHINKVWVITTKHFTNNAKNVMAEKPYTGVSFIDGEKLAHLMAKYEYNINSELSTSVAICLTNQLNLADKLKNQSIGLGLINTDQIFINQQVFKLDYHRYADRKSQSRKQKQKRMSIQSAIEQSLSLMICGAPGSGKTKMLQKILSDYASDEQYQITKAIPIFTTCKDMLEKHEGKISNLIEKFKEEHYLTDDISSLYTVIIDGIDECGLTRDERLKHIKNGSLTRSRQQKKKKEFIA